MISQIVDLIKTNIQQINEYLFIVYNDKCHQTQFHCSQIGQEIFRFNKRATD